MISIDRALLDRKLLGGALGDAASWSTWFVVLRAAFGLVLNAAQLKVFASVAGNRHPPNKRCRELWCVIGRRSGKSRIAAALAVFIALFIRHKLSPGERGQVIVLAASQEQAKTVFAYAKGFLSESDALRKEVASMSQSEIRLRNGITISIHANSFRTVRGRTLVLSIFDEIAFWKAETSVAPDAETFRRCCRHWRPRTEC